MRCQATSFKRERKTLEQENFHVFTTSHEQPVVCRFAGVSRKGNDMRYNGQKMKMLCSIRHLLLLTSFTGILNLVYLMFFADLKGNVELYTLSSSIVLRRQIASIQVDSEAAKIAAGPSLSYLELLNLDLKDIVQRYLSSSETVAKHYEVANLQDDNLPQQKFGHKSVPRCSPSLFLLIMVHSSPANFMDRESIRLSWGREDNPINQGSWTNSERSWKTVFLVGQSNSSNLNNLLEQEARVHNDIVIGDFRDTFRNLSLKTLFGLQWSFQHCQAKYILKTDEDCFVNVLSLLEWLQEYHVTNGSKPIYTGNVQTEMEVMREKSHRYYVSTKDFNQRVYPPYASGGGYVFSVSLLPKLIEASKRVPIIPVEDACFGLYMQEIGVKPLHNTRILPYVFCDNTRTTLHERPICHFRKPLVVHGIKDLLHIQTHYNVLLMSFMPTICSYVDNQSASKNVQLSC
ncbi:beta-1,3-galactosyltransferase 5-like isoform X3 [Montipora capricornis]|uniref:beta-1,3-galactosyltransferase 5-like isoform X3 n=1 Tax=Montipora capricornis TaxID=246305 RepID=UPI0035F1DF85